MTDKERLVLTFAILESFGTSSSQFLSKDDIRNLSSQFEAYFDDVTTVNSFLEKNSRLGISLENIEEAHRSYAESILFNH